MTACSPALHNTKFEEAVTLQDSGKTDEAIAAYYAALEDKPGLVEARQNLGAIFYQQKQYEKAEREFRLILAQDEKQVAARENLALVLEAKGGQDKEALDQWQAALANEQRPDWINYGRKSITRLQRKLHIEEPPSPGVPAPQSKEAPRGQSIAPSSARAKAPPAPAIGALASPALPGAAALLSPAPPPVGLIPIDVDQIPRFAAKPRPNDLAVVIGIERYQNLPSARHARADADSVAKYFRALGYAPRNVEVLLNERATMAGMKVALEAWLPARVRKESRVVLYYAGHGSPDPVTGETYLVPHDGNPALLKQTAYPLKTLYAKLAELNALQVVVAMDSCFSGRGERSVMMAGRQAVARIEDPVLTSPVLAVLAATQGTQISTSSHEKNHGLFTYYFLSALHEGKTQLGDIFDYLHPRVEDEAKLQYVQQSPNLLPSAQDIRAFTLWEKE